MQGSVPRAPEIVAKAMIKPEYQGTGAPLSRDLRRAQQIRTAVEAKTGQGNGWETAFATMREEPDRRAKATQLAQEIKDPQLKDRAEKAEKLIDDYLDVGYDGLKTSSNVPDLARQKQLRDLVELELKRNPAMREVLNNLPAGDKDKYLRELLTSDDGVRNAIVKRYKEFRDSQQPLTDSIFSTIDNRDIAKLERDDKLAQQQDINRRLQENQTQLDEYSVTKKGSSGKFDQLDSLQGKAQSLQSEIDGWKLDSVTKNKNLGKLQLELQNVIRSGIPDPNRSIDQIRQEITDIQNEIKQLNSQVKTNQIQLDEKARLEIDKKSLEDSKVKLQGEKRLADIDVQKAEADLRLKQRVEEAAKILRTSQEVGRTTGFENVVSQATEEWFHETYKQYSEAYTDVTKSEPEQALFDSMRREWNKQKPKMFGKGYTYPINNAAVELDTKELLDKGPDGLLNKLVDGMKHPDGTAYTDDERMVVKLDSAFMDKMRPEAVKQLLVRKIMSGGITKNEVTLIATAPWGQKVLQEAINQNSEIQQMIKNLIGSGDLKDPGFRDKFGTMASKGSGLAMAAMLAAIPGFFALSQATQEEKTT